MRMVPTYVSLFTVRGDVSVASVRFAVIMRVGGHLGGLRAAYQFARKTLNSSFRGIETNRASRYDESHKMQAAGARIIQTSLLAIFYLVVLTQMPKQLQKRFIGGDAINGR
jgi:hypothetical protein